MDDTIQLIEGDVAYDDRGSVSYVNGFNFSGIKRFYQVENISKDIVRAFHGHLNEEKYVYVAAGCAKVICAKISEDKLVEPKAVFTLNSKKPAILRIPKGYANGFKALENGTTVIFFSTSSLQESKNDDLRFAWDIFGKEIWEVGNR